MPKSKQSQSFETFMEEQIVASLKEQGVESVEHTKRLNIGVRWAAVKARISMPDAGGAFEEDD